MPTLSGDTQAVLATDKVRFQGQEVAFVVADDRYAARDALELIDVEYDPLTPLMDGRRALDDDAPIIRDDLEGKADNHIFDWESGDAAKCDEVFAGADVVVTQDMLYPRSHPAPLETCGSLAHMDKVTGKLTAWITSQAPHAHRTVYALVAGLPEHKIQVISPDIGGGFGNKVPIYPGYVLAVVGSIVTGKPVKWMEDRSENLMSTGFARDYHMHGEIAATSDGKILGLRVNVIADHGAFNASANPTKFPAGFFNIFTGSYDLQAAYCKVTGVYSNKAPGGVAYACSFRVTEAVYLVERIVDVLAAELGMDPAELRMRNLLRPEQFPYLSQTGWEYDSGETPGAATGARRRRLRRAAPRAGGEAGPGRAHGHRPQLLHRGRGRRSPQAHGHPRPRHGRRLRAAHPFPRERRSCGSACRPRARATRRPSPRSWPASSASRPRTSRWSRRPDPDPVRPRRLRLPLRRGLPSRRGCGGRRVRDRPDREPPRRWSAPRRPRVGARPLVREGRPVQGRTIQEIARARPTAASSCQRAWRGTSTPAPFTTRPT